MLRRPIAVLVISTALVSLPRIASSASGVQVAMTPAGQTITPGSDFYLDVMVTQPSQAFNAWDGTLVYDPQALTYLPAVPSTAQQGCLMTGGCSTACGSTYLNLAPGPDSLYIINSLLCYHIYITQAGQLFHLHFRASNQPQQTSVYFKSLRFTDGAGPMGPVTYTPAQIGIGMPATAVDHPASAAGLRLSASPNPARGSVTLAVGSEQSGQQELTVRDVQGRSVRVLTSGWQAAGSRQLAWDGTDDSGSRVAPGVYLVTLRVGNQQTQSHVTLLY
jgi:hypothetical protein